MIHVIPTNRQAWIAMFTLFAIITVGTLIVLNQLLIGLLVMLLSALALTTLYRQSISTASTVASTAAQSGAWQYDPQEPVLLTSIISADGETHTARVVPLEQREGHQLLLTIDGYLVIDSSGRVIHKL